MVCTMRVCSLDIFQPFFQQLFNRDRREIMPEQSCSFCIGEVVCVTEGLTLDRILDLSFKVDCTALVAFLVGIQAGEHLVPTNNLIR